MYPSFSKNRIFLLLSLSFVGLVSVIALFAALPHPAQAARPATYVSGPIITHTAWLESPTCSVPGGHLLYLPTMIKP